MMIGALEVAIRAIKEIGRAAQEVVVVIQCVRAADCRAQQQEDILVSTNRSLLRYVCLNLVSIRINLTNQ